MEKFFNFHDLDIPLSNACFDDNVSYCQEREVDKSEWSPFLSFPITKACNFKCIYCGMGGEATGSQDGNIALSQIKTITEVAIKKGIKKFRLTGGEPFLHNDIAGMLHYFSQLGYFTLVNTNGSLIAKFENELSNIDTNIRFAVSLDTLQPDKLKSISKNNCHIDVVNGIRFLSSKGLLLRCNMVVSKYNIDEVPSIIKFCRSMHCDLKILDIVSVPLPYGKRGDFYQEVNSLESYLTKSCDEIFSHEYSRGFGTPCFRYRFGETFVTVKNSKKGSHYDTAEKGICKGCKYFPCHEGLYDIFALSDNRLCACRWTEKQKSNILEEQMQYLIDAFRRAKYYPVGNNPDMGTRTELIKPKKRG